MRRVSFRGAAEDSGDDAANNDDETSVSLQDLQDGGALGREARERRALLLKQRQRERRLSRGGIASDCITWATAAATGGTPGDSRRGSQASSSKSSFSQSSSASRRPVSSRKGVSLEIPWNANFSPRNSDASFPSLGQLKAWSKHRRSSFPTRLFLSSRRQSPSGEMQQQQGNRCPTPLSGRFSDSASRLLLQQADGFQALPSERSHQEMLRSAFDREVNH